MDGLKSSLGLEFVSVVAEVGGNYHLEIRPVEGGTDFGRYEVRVKELRDVTPEDQRSLAAQKVFAEGSLLADQRRPELLLGAIERYKNALQLWRELGDKQGEAYGLTAVGRLYDLQGEKLEAFEHFSQALPFWQAAGERDGEASALYFLGRLHPNTVDHLTALDHLDHAARLYRALNNKAGEADALMSLSRVHLTLGDKAKSIEYCSQSLAIRRSVGSRSEEISSLLNLAILYRPDKQKSLVAVEQAYSLRLAIVDPTLKVRALYSISSAYRDLGEKEKALTCLKEALKLFHHTGDRQREAEALFEHGNFYGSVGKEQKALEYFQKSLSMARAMEIREGEASTLNSIGLLYRRMGNKGKAIESTQRALSLFQALKNRSGEAAMLMNLASFHNEDKQKALEYYSQALSLWRAVGQSFNQFSTLRSIGQIHALLNDRQKGQEFFNEALKLSRSIGSRRAEADSLGDLAGIYDETGESQKSLSFANQALPLARSLENQALEARLLGQIGLSYSWMGEYQEAINHYSQALKLHQTTHNSSGQALILTNVGYVYDILGEKSAALNNYSQALALSREARNRYTEALTLVALGFVRFSSGELREALEHYRRALPIAQETKDKRVEGLTLGAMGLVYDALGDKQKALDYLNQGLPLIRAAGDRIFEATGLTNIGLIHDTLGDKQKALDYYNQALVINRSVNDYRGEAATLYGLARIERERGHLDEARAQIETALQRIELLRTKTSSQELRASFFASVYGYYDFYVDLLMRLHKERPADGFQALALQASERSRARSLLDSLAESRSNIREGVDAALLARERTLQQQLNTKAGARFQLLASSSAETQVTANKTEVEALITELQQVRAQIRQTSPRYAALTQPQPLTLTEIQQVLDADTALLEYSLGDERSYLWVVTPTTINSFELPKRAEIETTAQQVYELTSARNSDTGSEASGQRVLRLKHLSESEPAAAARLSQMLLGPVAGQLNRKRLVIIPDGALHYVPFAALPDPKLLKGNAENSQPLVVDHEIVYLPSASTLAVQRRELARRKPAAKTFAVLADPVFTTSDNRFKERTGRPAAKSEEPITDLIQQRILKRVTQGKGGVQIARLPFTRQEAEQILALAPAGEGMKALDFGASRATATSDQLSQYRYVHFATHGLADSERPELSTIVLSLFDEQGRPQDGFLRAHEVYNLKLPAEMVVLSACETGLGKLTKGEGLVSLTRGFMYAGAARVVVSLWSVNDKATAELMTKFYHKILVEGERPAAALRAAQVEMWRTKQWQAPYYWAAFTMQGEWQ